MAEQPSRKKTRRIALSGLLVALMLILGYIENLIPTGVPGVKLGLSNGVLIFAIYMLGIPNALTLMILKVFLSGLLFGFSAVPYALAGGVASMAVMALLSRVDGVHPVVVSMAGGVMHNVGQVGMAMLILQTSGLLYYMAILMAVGLGCGAVTGVCASAVMKHLKALRR